MKRSHLALLVAVLLGAGAFLTFTRANVGPVERGRRIARRTGCFTCHGPEGGRGMPDPGHGLGDVPTWGGGLLTMYAENEGEIREWILDGMPARIRKDPSETRERQGATILMPAFRSLLSRGEVDDLVAYVKAVANYDKLDDPKAEAGRKVAEAMGCFNCHGPGGRAAPENPRSFKGYIPSWSGKDFPELAKDDSEIRAWIQMGITPRFRDNVLARFFVNRQAVKMPAYGSHLSPEDLDRLLDYIHWLRRHPD